MNKESITFLTTLEMDGIYKLRCTNNKITKTQQEARINITEPHTFDKVQIIMKAKTAGDYFHAGGWAYNCDDAMVATQMNELEERKNMLEKKRNIIRIERNKFVKGKTIENQKVNGILVTMKL